jgi:endonuclease/exonuclease/phosphatase family metal-dependent hydrolase
MKATWRSLAIATCLARLLIGCSDDDGTSQGELSVVNLNILHGVLDEDPDAEPYDRFPERLSLIADDLADRAPDLVLLQEVGQISPPGYPEVIGTITDALDGSGRGPYESVFGRIDGAEPTVGGGQGLGQATLTRLPILTVANHLVVRVPGGTPRNVLHVRVDTPLGEVDSFNAHLQGPNVPEDAATEMRDVLAFIDSHVGPDGIALLAGDLNSHDTASVYDVLRAAGFVDLATEAGLRCEPGDNSGCTNDTLPLAEPGNRTSVRLDYLWLRAPGMLEPRRVALAFDEPFPLAGGGVLWASDHRGVAADF